VKPGAAKDAVKRAYRKLVLRTHPDIAQDGGSHERFIQVRWHALRHSRASPNPQL